MRRTHSLCIIIVAVCCCASVPSQDSPGEYVARYGQCLGELEQRLGALANTIRTNDPAHSQDVEGVKKQIHDARVALKAFDIRARYLDPINHRRNNGPLPVEWETEVFEKYEKPYRREGAGLMLAELYLGEPDIQPDSLLRLVNAAIVASGSYRADSVTRHLVTPDHFFFCNRSFLLNLAGIYSTGFECPDPERVVPELRDMLASGEGHMTAFNASFPTTRLPAEYLDRFHAMVGFVEGQPDTPERFDHFAFISEHVVPLFRLNQELIARYGMRSTRWMDYSLNNRARSLFAKDLYAGQDARGIFRHATDPEAIAGAERLGKLLFFDPLLSGNKQRSCASCHHPGMCFTDTVRATAVSFDHAGNIARNAPSLVNADLNHLMQDGKHISLQAQARAVITDPLEMSGSEADVLRDVLSCPDYRKGFEALLPHTPQAPSATMDHVLSALTMYYVKFSAYRSPFDEAMDRNGEWMRRRARDPTSS